jgi:hypothetical protein
MASKMNVDQQLVSSLFQWLFSNEFREAPVLNDDVKPLHGSSLLLAISLQATRWRHARILSLDNEDAPVIVQFVTLNDVVLVRDKHLSVANEECFDLSVKVRFARYTLTTIPEDVRVIPILAECRRHQKKHGVITDITVSNVIIQWQCALGEWKWWPIRIDWSHLEKIVFPVNGTHTLPMSLLDAIATNGNIASYIAHMDHRLTTLCSDMGMGGVRDMMCKKDDAVLTELQRYHVPYPCGALRSVSCQIVEWSVEARNQWSIWATQFEPDERGDPFRTVPHAFKNRAVYWTCTVENEIIAFAVTGH